MFLKLLTTIALLMPIMSNRGYAQEIFILGFNGDLHSIDPKTGNLSLIGLTGIHDHLWTGLTQDSQGRLYSASGHWTTGYAIYQLDPLTGLATFVVDTNFTGIGSMAFGPNDTLYIGHDPKHPGSGGIYDLYTLDLSNGLESLIGSTGAQQILSLDFSGDQLYGANPAEGLLAIDTLTGIATDVNSNFSGPVGATISMCFDDHGACFYIDHGLWLTDQSSGTRHPIEWVSSFGYWTEAVFREGAATNFSLWLNGTTGHYMQAKMTGITPNGEALVLWAKGRGGPNPIPPGLPCAGTMMDLNANMQKVKIVTADANGEAVVGPGLKRVPSAARGLIWMQAIDMTTCGTSNKILFYI